MNPDLRALFDAGPGFLNTATVGIPPSVAVDSMAAAMDDWRRGVVRPTDFDPLVDRGRAAWARMIGVDVSTVAAGLAVSPFVGLIAGSLSDGARVLTADGDFTSVLFPMLAQTSRNVTVDSVPLEELADADGPVDLIAVSVVQSADGRVADLDQLLAAKSATGARLLVDVTQASGWLPLSCREVDFVVCAAYKWLLCPRGVAFLAARPEHWDSLRPDDAGWYAGDDPWTSIYGAPLRLAPDARRFNVSPAWLCWSAAAPTLELLASLDPGEVHAHDVGLADLFLAELGRPSQGSAIVTVDSPDAAERLAAAGIQTAVRAGRVRASFHLYNTADDARAAAAALR
ncbi:MAG TPA: aminotransferase class V-fold PLP-dependent enzyme [Nocardioidaceae bacterium]|nr:aminotransferase class V-fold PLP-dependent enzyme [Nocardioidaceae bacterium]